MGRIKYLFLIGLYIFASNAFAGIKIISISDHFFSTGTESGTTLDTTRTIYTGQAGNVTCSTTSTTPCNTCANLDLSATGPVCNQKSIYGALQFVVTFTSDTASSFDSSSVIAAAIDSTAVAVSSASTQAPLSAGQQLQAVINWTEICSKPSLGADANCATSFSAALKVGISKAGSIVESVTINIKHHAVSAGDLLTTDAFHTNCDSGTDPVSGEGICGFTVNPGDEKVYINDVIKASSWPTSHNSSYNFWGVRFYYAPGTTYTSVIPGDATTASADIQVSTDGTMTPTKITGLNNDVDYVFLAASLDVSGNVFYFTNPNLAMPTDEDGFGLHTARPSQVYGLLDKQKCFIATAAYGSDLDPKIEIFRNFRDQILLKNNWGRKFVSWYYKNGPTLASVIAESNWLRAVVRLFLWPILLFAQISLQIGLLYSLLSMALGLVLVRLAYLKLWQRFF